MRRSEKDKNCDAGKSTGLRTEKRKPDAGYERQNPKQCRMTEIQRFKTNQMFSITVAAVREQPFAFCALAPLRETKILVFIRLFCGAE